MIENKKDLDKFKIGNRFETDEYIGSGSTGIVYKGRDLTNNKVVAIKSLKTEFCKNDKFIDSLNNELQELLHLEHQNIIRFYEIIHENDKYFIIMEYVNGQSLEQLLKEKTSIDIHSTVQIISQLAKALNHASEKNIFHKALKPENIIISDNNQVKLTDFGFAKAVSIAWFTLTGTSPTQVEYMSPEQAEGENIDQRTDIYSLGIIAYQMLTGDVPFKRDGTSILSVAIKHINNKAEPLTSKNPAVPVWLDNIILKCLEKSPEKRFQNGKELFEALNKKENVSNLNKTAIISPEDMDINTDELNMVLSDSYNYISEPDISSTLIINNFEEELKNHFGQKVSKDTEIIPSIKRTDILFAKKTRSLEDENIEKNIEYLDKEDIEIYLTEANSKTKRESNRNRIMLILFILLILLCSALILYISANS